MREGEKIEAGRESLQGLRRRGHGVGLRLDAVSDRFPSAPGTDAAAVGQCKRRGTRNAMVGFLDRRRFSRPPAVHPTTGGLPDDLLRLSIGIEDPGDLLADLELALAGDGP